MANSSSDKQTRVRVCVCVLFFLWLVFIIRQVASSGNVRSKTFVKKYGKGNLCLKRELLGK